MKWTWESRHYDEMVNIARNRTHVLRSNSYYRGMSITRLINCGFLIPKSDIGNPTYRPDLLSHVGYNKTVVLTDKGKDWIMNLDPDSYDPVYWFSVSPEDVRGWQNRLRDKQVYTLPSDTKLDHFDVENDSDNE